MIHDELARKEGGAEASKHKEGQGKETQVIQIKAGRQSEEEGKGESKTDTRGEITQMVTKLKTPQEVKTGK